MIRPVRVHRPDNTKIVRERSDLREDLTDFYAALAILLELEGRLEQITRLALRLQIPAGIG